MPSRQGLRPSIFRTGEPAPVPAGGSVGGGSTEARLWLMLPPSLPR
jgi:hypothetical protein